MRVCVSLGSESRDLMLRVNMYYQSWRAESRVSLSTEQRDTSNLLSARLQIRQTESTTAETAPKLRGAATSTREQH